MNLHIHKENNILFVMADQQLKPEQQAVLSERFHNFEHADMEAGTHEEYLKMVERLEKDIP